MLKFKKFLHFHYICFLQQQFPTFLAPGTGFMGDNVSKDGGGGDGFKMFQALGFSRQEHWNGLPFPSPEDLPDPGIKPGSPAL